MLADATTGEIAGWVAGTVAVLTTLGAGGKWLLDWLAARRDKARQAEQQGRKDAMGELYEVLAVLRKDNEENRHIIHEVRGELNAAKLELIVCQREVAECRQDRDALHGLCEDMAAAMRAANLSVPYRPASLRPPVKPPEGDR